MAAGSAAAPALPSAAPPAPAESPLSHSRVSSAANGVPSENFRSSRPGRRRRRMSGLPANRLGGGLVPFPETGQRFRGPEVQVQPKDAFREILFGRLHGRFVLPSSGEGTKRIDIVGNGDVRPPVLRRREGFHGAPRRHPQKAIRHRVRQALFAPERGHAGDVSQRLFEDRERGFGGGDLDGPLLHAWSGRFRAQRREAPFRGTRGRGGRLRFGGFRFRRRSDRLERAREIEERPDRRRLLENLRQELVDLLEVLVQRVDPLFREGASRKLFEDALGLLGPPLDRRDATAHARLRREEGVPVALDEIPVDPAADLDPLELFRLDEGDGKIRGHEEVLRLLRKDVGGKLDDLVPVHRPRRARGGELVDLRHQLFVERIVPGVVSRRLFGPDRLLSELREFHQFAPRPMVPSSPAVTFQIRTKSGVANAFRKTPR